MKITLSDTPLLSTQQIGELASTLDLLHKRTLAAIERLNKDIATRKQQIAARWKTAPGLGGADVARFAEHETVATVREIKDNSKAELDKILKDGGDSLVLGEADRKSTRLNSSHSQISYAVFCLKKKTQ